MSNEQLQGQEPATKPAQVDNKMLKDKVVGQFTQYDINTLKSTIAAGLNNPEFNLFLNTCVATGLNPFLKQIIPVVYESQKNGRRFDIQVPVEGIEHLARQKEGWLGYEVQLVCEKDNFLISRDKENENWIVAQHEVSFPRGRIMGCYCIAKRKGFKDVTVIMDLSEVQHLTQDFRTKNMWEKWLGDMFKKHVKKRALREQFGIEIDDMSDLNNGPETYENTIPAYNNAAKKEIQNIEPITEEEELDLEQALIELWDDIGAMMHKFNISQEAAVDISKRRFNGKTPKQLNPQELAAFKRFIELEGQVTKAKKGKEAQIEPETWQIEEKEPPRVPKEAEAEKQPEKAKDDIEEIEDFFEQGELF